MYAEEVYKSIRVKGRMKGGVRIRSEGKKRGENERDNGGKEEGEFSISIMQVSAAVTHSVDKHSTMVWFLRLNFLFHCTRLYLIPQLQKFLPLQKRKCKHQSTKSPSIGTQT